MSSHVMARVWETSQHKGTKLLVMLALAEYSGPEGVCWPGVHSLAEMVRVKDTRWIRRTLRELEESGELITLASAGGRGARSTNLYFVTCVPVNTEAIIGALMDRRSASKAEAIEKAGEITLLLQEKGGDHHPLGEGDSNPTRGGESTQEAGSPSPSDPLLSVIKPLGEDPSPSHSAAEPAFAGGLTKEAQLGKGSAQEQSRKSGKKKYRSGGKKKKSKESIAAVVAVPETNPPLCPKCGVPEVHWHNTHTGEEWYCHKLASGGFCESYPIETLRPVKRRQKMIIGNYDYEDRVVWIDD